MRSLTATTSARWGIVHGINESRKGIALGVAGHPDIDALVTAAEIQADLVWAGQDGYAIASLQASGRSLLLVAANSPQGALYGAFRVASLAGARFYLSRESLQHGLHCEAFSQGDAPWPAFRLAERPRFAARGALPWFNFLSGPTAWDQEDWAVYVDNLARSRANMLGFHVYTGGLERYYPYVEPFVQVEADGVLPEAELDTTETARWGYRPLSTQRFAAGSSLLFSDAVFGSEAAVPRGDLRSRYDRAQTLLAWVMKRAKSWGIKSFIGFEAGIVPPEVHSLVPGDARLPGGELDPFHPAAERIFHRTLAHIVATYPDLDALWLFQHEHVLFSRIAPTSHAALEAYCRRHGDAFPELSEETRWKGPWLLAWLESAWRWKERHAPHLKIAVSGWGGGSQFPKLIPGLDRTLPKDVVLTTLIPGQGEGTLPPELERVTGRERIAVPWWEGDAQLWHPQPRVQSLLEQQDDFAAHGVNGSIGLHWRTQDVEANAWAFFESCWERKDQPSLSAAQCYTDYAARGLGLGQGTSRSIELPASGASESGAAAEVGSMLLRAEKERWFRGAHSPVYFGYTSKWGRLEREQRSVIEGAVADLVALGKRASSPRSPAFDHLVHSLRFALHFDAWSKAIEDAEHALSSGDAQSAFQILSVAPARQALQSFAARVMTQGDRGALASVNQRVWQTHSNLLAQAAKELKGELPCENIPSPQGGGAVVPLEASDSAVAMPTRTFWDVLDDDKLSWRVFCTNLDAAAAFLVVKDRDATRRLAMERTGPAAFGLSLSAQDLAKGASDVLDLWVEVLPLGSVKPTIPKGGKLTVTVFRGAPSGAGTPPTKGRT